ncbi:hypothetical protein CSKR_202293 [Clonorchis sinensis]|uniref:Uncharacterized protein n=1 Tax=Clonorchis sinensis TaxID=79923 RepID=A0A8T1MTQ0_CLOSI|nr:hypothetical protein CSKR_202293 [Clonorchis sinensis]
MSQTAPEDVQMNEDRDRDTAMPENPVHQSENVDDSSREETGLPSDAAAGEGADEQSADQSATDSSPTTQPMAGENTPDQPAIADECDQTRCNEVISDANET